MNKTLIGIIFIITGVLYGSLAIDAVYNTTLGYLIKHQWIKPPPADKIGKLSLGRKPAILMYSLSLILIGIYLLWNRQI